MRDGATEPLGIHVFVGHRLHDVRAGHEHVARPFHHDREVGDRWGIDGAARAWTHDDGKLRDHTRSQGVAQEDIGIAAEGHDPFLDASAARIVQADDRCPHLHRHVHDLADLLGVRLRETATEDREVLAEDEHQAAIDGAVAGHDAVAQERFLHLGVAVRDERIEFDERIRVEQQLQPLPSGQLAASMLLVDALSSTTQASLLPEGIEACESLLVGRHGWFTSRTGRVFAQGRRSSYVPGYPRKW
jgi:hypothetical protein